MPGDAGNRPAGDDTDNGAIDHFLRRLRNFLDDATSLEVNTIVCREITGNKMPPLAAAVREIWQSYTETLREQTAPVTTWSQADIDRLREQLREVASLGSGPRDELLAQLQRIESLTQPRGAKKTAVEVGNTVLSRLDRCREHGVFDRAPEDFNPRQVMCVRKAWELRSSRVAMQTTVQMDGDTVTRINQAEVENTRLLAVHNDAVGAAVKSWRNLAQLLIDMLRGRNRPPN